MSASAFLVTIAGLVLFYGPQQTEATQLWTIPGAIPTTVPAACRAVLVQNITCANNLVTPSQVSNGMSLMGDEAAQYCTAECYSSLRTFQTNVDAKCGDTMYAMYANSTLVQSGASLADGLVWAYNVSCIQDESGLCLASLYGGNKTACSDCALKYGAAMLSSDYGRGRVSSEAFSSLLSSCSADPASYTYTYTSTTTTPGTTTTTAASHTCTGTTYIASGADTCESISEANGVATDLMIYRNNLDYNCTVLSAGTSLCLQDTCTLKTLDRNYTCSEITDGQSFSLLQLVSWNPSIHSNCDNLDSMIGRSICVSPPGGGTFDDVNNTVTHSPRPTLASSLFTSWIPGSTVDDAPDLTTSWYTPTLHPTATVTSNATWNETLSSVVAELTQFCWLTDEDWAQGVNEEDYAEGCQTLLDTYCFPTADAPVPTSPARIPAVCTPDRATYVTPADPTTTNPAGATPTPYQPGMIAGCQRFYKVISGDTCQKIADELDITLEQFYGWNPDVGENCQGLFLAYYVCVSA